MDKLEKRHAAARAERALERAALGEDSAEERAALAEALGAGDASLDARLAEVRRSDAEVLAEYPPEVMAARIQGALSEAQARAQDQRATGRFTRRLAPLGGVAAVGLALLIILNLPGVGEDSMVEDATVTRPGAPGAAEEAGVRIKGPGARLIVWRKGDDGRAERLKEGARASAGDVLQLEYSAGGADFGVICSLDGRGEVSLHYPAYPDEPTRLDEGRNALEFAFELDDAPGFERFFFLSAQEALDVDEMKAAIEALASAGDPARAEPKLPEYVEVTSFVLEKK